MTSIVQTRVVYSVNSFVTRHITFNLEEYIFLRNTIIRQKVQNRFSRRSFSPNIILFLFECLNRVFSYLHLVYSCLRTCGGETNNPILFLSTAVFFKGFNNNRVTRPFVTETT